MASGWLLGDRPIAMVITYLHSSNMRLPVKGTLFGAGFNFEDNQLRFWRGPLKKYPPKDENWRSCDLSKCPSIIGQLKELVELDLQWKVDLKKGLEVPRCTGRDPYIIHLNIATCQWWFPFTLLKKPHVSNGRNMWLWLRKPEFQNGLPW